MAWTNNPSILLTLIFTDDDQATGEMRISFPVAQRAYVSGFAQTIIPLLRAVSNCALTHYTISIGMQDHSAETTGAASAMDVGTFIYRTTPDERWRQLIPGLRAAKIATHGDYPGIEINVNDSDVQAFLDVMSNGINGITPVDPWGAALNSLTAAYQQKRRQIINNRY